jgi:hypothetical protein
MCMLTPTAKCDAQRAQPQQHRLEVLRKVCRGRSPGCCLLSSSLQSSKSAHCLGTSSSCMGPLVHRVLQALRPTSAVSASPNSLLEQR